MTASKHFFYCSIYYQSGRKGIVFPAKNRSCLKAVIFSANRSQTDQVKTNLLHITDEVYPVGLCPHILPDASLRICSGFLVGPVSERLGASGFLIEFLKNVQGWTQDVQG